jgi:serine/threonine protein kinase
MKNFKSLKFVENINEVYTITNKIGQGSFGSVNRAQRVGGSIDVAIKIINKKSLLSNPMLPTLMMSELVVLKKCSHPNIM